MTETPLRAERPKHSPLYGLILPLIYAAAVIAVFTGIAFRLQSSERALCSGVAFRAAAELGQNLNGLKKEASLMASSISNNPDLTKPEAARIAEGLLTSRSYVSGVSIAPSALVRYHFPEKEGESLIGHDLLSNPERRTALTQAMERKAPVFSGPFESLDGGPVLFIRYPVFSAGKFWGFVSITLDFDGLVDAFALESLYPGFAFALSAVEQSETAVQGGSAIADGEAEDLPGLMIAGDSTAFKLGVTSSLLPLQGIGWRLHAIPDRGWLALSPWLYLLGVAALAGAFFLFAWIRAGSRKNVDTDSAVELSFPLSMEQGKKTSPPFPEVIDGPMNRLPRERSTQPPKASQPSKETQQAKEAQQAKETQQPKETQQIKKTQQADEASSTKEIPPQTATMEESAAESAAEPAHASTPSSAMPSDTVTITFKGPSVKGQLYMPDVLFSGDPKDLFAHLRAVEDKTGDEPNPEPAEDQKAQPIPAAVQKEPKEHRAESVSAALAILVVDDSEANRDIMGRMLALRGYESEFAASGEEALARCSAKEFAIIFMDCFMPGMDGYKTSELIRSARVSSKTKIVGMSARVGAKELERCQASGMNELLSKPFTLSQLTAMIQGLAGQSR
ncbi:MAG: response regulator [Spirochaetia bacterium]|nr:response regulator [Spirochaetia bacterium]